MNKILKNIKVPTGNICIMQAEKGKLEFVSLQDYGKAKNIKADFLGYTKEINQVPHGNSLDLEEISKIGKMLDLPKGRKYTLNFAIGDEFEVNAEKLRDLFNPEKFMVKITPIHLTNACKENNIVTSNGYFDYSPYREIENNLKNVGFDVLVFIPSIEEDTSRITCGNAILSRLFDGLNTDLKTDREVFDIEFELIKEKE